MNVKRASRELADIHNEIGAATSFLHDDPLEVYGDVRIVNVHSDIIVREGKDLAAKTDIRRYLWRLRGTRTLNRKNSVLWSMYDEDQNYTYCGVGALVEKSVAYRLHEKNPRKHVVFDSVEVIN